MGQATGPQRVAAKRVYELLTELVEIVGPNFDGGGPRGVEDATWVLGEWIVVAAWHSIESHEMSPVLTRFVEPDTAMYRWKGLLFEALHTNWDD